MSPFAPLIRLFREMRNLRQKDAAELLGYEPSYLSALENGCKTAPQSDFLDLLIKRYKLSDEEIEKLMDSYKRSQRRYLVPLNATCDEYDIFYLLNNRIGTFSSIEITMLRMILDSKKSTTQH